MRRGAAVLLAVFILASFLGFATAVLRGSLDRSVQGDGPFFIGLARSMAAGNGYVLERSPWPHDPHLGRLPVWPAMLILPCLLFPHAGDDAILRVSAVIAHALAAAALALLTFRFRAGPAAAFIAGALFAAFPTELGLVENGLSEPSFFAFAIFGTVLLLENGWKQLAGAALLGISVLVRSNMVLLPFAALAVSAVFWSPALRAYWQRTAVLTAVFLLPAGLWIARNYAVSGVFPLLSAMEGETLYGGNNAVNASRVDEWGDWVFPDFIPGEKPKKELGRRMNEAALNRYYDHQAVTYARENWRNYPRLILGKLVRAFVPVPWTPAWSAWLIAGARCILFAGFIWALWSRSIRNTAYELFVSSMFVITLATTVLFYGSFRFTFSLEAFLMPWVAIAAARLVTQRISA